MEAYIKETAEKWTQGNYDEATKKEVARLLKEDETEIIDSFYKNLEFGTGGLRGVIGVGTNRMNNYTVGMATQGFANYIKQQFPDEDIKVAVIHDCRIRSREFAEATAKIFAANGFKVYLSEELRPTPELSYAIRHLGCKAGVNITASHNPCKYNGYKAYWEDGCQLVAPHDKNVIDEVLKIESIDDVKWEGNAENITIWSEEIDKPYLEAVKELSLAPEAIKNQKDLKIVFTPIHGTGITLIPRVLQELGFENVNVVEEQANVSGEFPSLKKPGTPEIKEEDYPLTEWLRKLYDATGSPNPEEESALKLAMEKGKEMNADIIMGTDPDADRIGFVVKNSAGKYEILNGNQAGALLVYYLVKKWKENGKLQGKEFVVKTIVTTELITNICSGLGVEMYDVLTGFKFIGEMIKLQEGKKQFIGGGEESYGYLAGDFVRDKDAVIAAALMAEAAAVAKEDGKSLFDVLLDVYTQFGFFKEALINIVREGKSGAEEIQQMMVDYRANPPKEINGSKVVSIKDYQAQKEFDIAGGSEKTIDLPKSNVLQFFTEDGSKVTVRPSGTEPKIKFYVGVKEELASKDQYDAINAKLDRKIADIKTSLKL